MSAVLVAEPGQKAHMGAIEVTILEARVLVAGCIKYSVAWVTGGVRYEQVVDAVEVSHEGLRSLDVGFR